MCVLVLTDNDGDNDSTVYSLVHHLDLSLSSSPSLAWTDLECHTLLKMLMDSLFVMCVLVLTDNAGDNDSTVYSPYHHFDLSPLRLRPPVLGLTLNATHS